MATCHKKTPSGVYPLTVVTFLFSKLIFVWQQPWLIKTSFFLLIQVREVCQNFSREDLRWQVYALLALQEVRNSFDFAQSTIK